MMTRRQRLFIARARRTVAIGLLITFGLLTICVASGAINGAEASESPATVTEEAKASDYEQPDPCGLAVVYCKGEPGYVMATLEGRIRIAASKAGINPDTAVRIAQCESTMNPAARNSSSSAAGLYQFTATTWNYIGAPGDRLNSDDAIAAFVKHYPTHPEWWVCK